MPENKIVRCDCGYRVRAHTEGRQVAEVRRHAWQAHGIAFSAEEALAVVRRDEAELDDAAVSGAAAFGHTASGKETG
jgi:hypothetical protein